MNYSEVKPKPSLTGVREDLLQTVTLLRDCRAQVIKESSSGPNITL